LTYTFIEALKFTYPYYYVRLLGGLLVIAGMLIMAWNTWKTFGMARAQRAAAGGVLQAA
jgi:cytochrome c oxidase cbb3-type subunit 1